MIRRSYHADLLHVERGYRSDLTLVMVQTLFRGTPDLCGSDELSLPIKTISDYLGRSKMDSLWRPTLSEWFLNTSATGLWGVVVNTAAFLRVQRVCIVRGLPTVVISRSGCTAMAVNATSYLNVVSMLIQHVFSFTVDDDFLFMIHLIFTVDHITS